MKIYKHKDYDEYVKAQTKKNLAKIKTVYIKLAEATVVAEHIKQNVPNVNFGLCHGTRNGTEIVWFKKLLKVNVLGTEISHTASKFKNTIEWDFHEVKNKWLGSVDFIYSNSFDHSYDHELCLDRWMSCIKKQGLCYIHQFVLESRKELVDSADCFSANINEYRDLFNTNYKIVDELSVLDNKIIFVIGHR